MSGLWGSFIPAYYQKICRQPVGRTIRFLLFFILAISVLIAVRATFAVKPGLRSVQSWADNNLKRISGGLPAIEVKDGLLIQPKSTYVLELGKDVVFAVEPDRNKEEDLLAKYKNVFLITGKQFVFQEVGPDSRTEVKRRDMAKDANLKLYPIESGVGLELGKNKIPITPATVAEWLKTIAIFVFPGLLLFIFVYFIFTKPIQILFFSLFGLIANNLLKTQAAYKQIFNISAYAVVPPTCLAVMLGLFPLNLPGFWFLFMAIFILYIFLGLHSVKNVEPAAGAPG
jgi:Protein of unknown function (DUF1189)